MVNAKIRIAFFVSGGGTDMQSVIDAIDCGKIENAEAVLVIASKPDIYAIERAKKHNIPSLVYQRQRYSDLNYMFLEIIESLRQHKVDLIVLAGYLSVLSPDIVAAYRGRIINVHPALIPEFSGKGFYGIRVHEAVIAAGRKESGVTVHFVDEGVDTGEVILQERVPVLEDDTPETLAARVLQKEHEVLPKAVSIIVSRLF